MHGITLKCKNCNTETEFRFGFGGYIGPWYYSENNFKELLRIAKEEELCNLDELLEFIKLPDVELKFVNSDAYICDKCGALHERYRFDLIAKDKKFIPKYKCDYCDGFLRDIKVDEEDGSLQESVNFICPNCGHVETFESEDDLIQQSSNQVLWD